MHSNTLLRALSAVALALGLGLAASAQEGESFIKRATELRGTPGTAGQSLEPLSAGAPVERTGEQKGAWIRIRTPQGAEGWVRLFDVGTRGGAAAPAPAGNAATAGLRGMGGLFGGSTASTTATSTAGIRGIGTDNSAPASRSPDDEDDKDDE
ncbi:MAG: SH3 domain-containing protein [Giesbergeria sp.]